MEGLFQTNLLFKGWFLGSMLICLGVTCQSRYGYEIGWNGWRGPGWTGNWKTCCVRDRPSLLGKLLLRFREIQRWELYRYHYPLWENYHMISHNTSWYMDVITSKKRCPMNEKQWKTVEGCSSGISKTCTKKTCCCKKVSPSGTWKRSQMTSLAIKRMLVHRLSSVHCKDVFVFFWCRFHNTNVNFPQIHPKIWHASTHISPPLPRWSSRKLMTCWKSWPKRWPGLAQWICFFPWKLRWQRKINENHLPGTPSALFFRQLYP